MQIHQSLPVLIDFFLSNLFVDGSGYFLNESELEEVLKNVETLLQYVLLFSIVVVLFLLFENAVLFFTRLHNK